MDSEDVDIAWNHFQRDFLQVLDRIVPLKEVRVKQRTQPWMNKDILDTIQLRDKVLKDLMHNKVPECFIGYKNLRKKSTKKG